MAIVLVASLIVGTIYVLAAIRFEEKRLTIAVKQGVESVAIKVIAQRYSRENNISIEIVELPYDTLYDEESSQLQNEHAARRGAIPPFDVIMVDDPWLYALASTGKGLRVLDDLILPNQQDYFDSALQVAEYCPGGKDCRYYAVPFVANSQLFVYRSGQFPSQRPPTWKEVVTSSKGNYVARIGPGNSIVTDFMPVLWAYDTESLQKDPDQLAPFSATGALANFRRLVGPGKKLQEASFDDFDVAAYTERDCQTTAIVWAAWAMMLADTDRKSTTLQKCPDTELVFTNVPTGSDNKSIPEMGAWLLAVPTNAINSKQAIDFITYADDVITHDLNEKVPADKSLAAARRLTPPARHSAFCKLVADPKLRRYPTLLGAIELSLEVARPRPRTVHWKQMEDVLGNFLEKLLNEPENSKNIPHLVDQANAYLKYLIHPEENAPPPSNNMMTTLTPHKQP
jgi:ABC-type glycerol-3-phosphate transport system substrate-binding protein